VRVVVGGMGLVLLLGTLGSVVRTLIVPRGTTSKPSALLWWVTRALLRAAARPLRGYEARDRLLAWQAPVLLVGALASWLGWLLLAYTLLEYGLSGLTFGTALREAGSSLFTLGFASTDRVRLSVVDFCAAATGPVVVALQISYLPTLYAAYNRREMQVTLLQSRAGEPAWGPELLARQALVRTTAELGTLYEAWEHLAADIGESHANYPVLLLFRSPQPYRSWIVALIAVVDAAAMHLALCPATAPPQARLMVRMTFTALRDVARVTGIRHDPDPRPDGPLLLTFEEFAAGVERVRATGFATERTAEEAWPDFRGWRVNYEEIACTLARSIDAVPALWTGPRDGTPAAMPPRRPTDRRPDDPDGARPRTTPTAP
jgi:hypothetical protein